jgi:hypothetical protein
MLDWGRQITSGERKYAVPADGTKTGSEKPRENRVNATHGKVNPKWS